MKTEKQIKERIKQLGVRHKRYDKDIKEFNPQNSYDPISSLHNLTILREKVSAEICSLHFVLDNH